MTLVPEQRRAQGIKAANARWANVTRKTLETICAYCEKPVALTGMARRDALRHGRAYCSREHSDAGRRTNISAAANRAHPPLDAVCALTSCGRTFTLAGLRRSGALRGRRTYCCREHSDEGRRVNIAAANKARQSPFSPNYGMRGRPTPEELLLFNAVPFYEPWILRQRFPTGAPVGSGEAVQWEADFFHPGLRLVIEIDGESHASHKFRERDSRKTAFLNSLGYTVIRVTNAEVRDDLQSVLDRIEVEAAASELALQWPAQLVLEAEVA